MRSKWEEYVGALFRKNKISFQYEPHSVTYVVEASYTPDFLIKDTIYIESKGWLKGSDRKKLIAVKKSNPDLDLRMWFQKDNYLTKSKKKRYSDWARANGFLYHVGDTLPKKWID